MTSSTAEGIDANSQRTAIGSGETPSEAVVRLVSEVTGKGPTSIEPLYDAVDTDALDALLERDGTAGDSPRIRFDYEGYEVQVDATRVRVRPHGP